MDSVGSKGGHICIDTVELEEQFAGMQKEYDMLCMFFVTSNIHDGCQHSMSGVCTH